MVATEHFGVTRGDPVKRRRRRTFAITITTEGVFLTLFVCGLAWVPFWLGSNRPIAWGINAVVFPGLAALYELSLLLRGQPHPVPIRRIGVSAVLFAVVIIWILVQNVSWTPTDWQHPIWHLATDALGQPIPGSISADRDLTALALLRLMTAASVFWLALQLGRDATWARMLIWSVVGISALYAAAGLFALGFMPNGRLFADLGPSKQLVTSTFVNQNHYVTFAGIGLVAGVAGILRLYRRELSRSGRLWRLKIGTLINVTGGEVALPLAFAVVIMTSLLLTGSRGGIIATAFGLFALFVLNVRKAGGSRRNEALLLLFAAVLVATAFIAFSDVLVGRITAQGLHDQGRPVVWIVTIKSILSAPLLGYGYGTFSAVFPMFRDDSTSVYGLWDKAHNTYLEVFQGLGLLFGAMLIACVVVLVWDCVKGARTRKRDATIPAIAASVSFLVGAHALVDFSLQLQAVTLTYMAVLGAGVAQASEPSLVGIADVPVTSSTDDTARWRISSHERWI
jgi:O-antigen ligase